MLRVLLRSPDDQPTGGAPADFDDDAPAGSGAPVSAGNPIAEASRAFIAGLTADQRTAPLTGPDDNAGADDEFDDSFVDAAPEGAQPAPITREDGASWNVELGRWQNPDGTMAAGAAPEGAKPAAVAPKPATPAKPAAAAAPAPTTAAKKVTLPGLAARGETDLEIEIDDPEIAERIRRLKNAGQRDAEAEAQVQQRVEQLEAREQSLQQAEDALAELEADPIAFTLSRMTPDRQIALAKAILVEHFDALIPEVDALADPAERLTRLREQLRATNDAKATLAAARDARRNGAAVFKATQALVPKGTDADTAKEFMRDALVILQGAHAQGVPVTPDKVPALLERRLKLYGFDAAAAAPASAGTAAAVEAPAAGSSGTTAIREARPVNDRARQLTDAAAQTAAARSTQSRMRSTQVRRAAATRVAPVGAGSAPVQPVVDPTADIKQVTRALRKQGMGSGWAPASP